MRALIAATLLTTISAAPAEKRNASQIVTHHVAAMKTASLDEIMSDYAPDTVVVTPPGLMPPPHASDQRGIFSGRKAARAVFAHLTNGDNIAGIRTMETRVEALNSDVAVLHWVQFSGTVRQISGRDYFVIRDGKIDLQDIVIDMP